MNFIQAPSIVKSLSEFEELIFNPSKLTFIEIDFFEKFNEIAKILALNKIKGNVVNIGIYKGGGALYMKSVFEELELIEKKWWLFDSFQGFNVETITSSKEIETLKWFNQYLENVDEPKPSDILDLFRKFNLHKNLNIVEGFIENTYKKYPQESISLLHIDVDFYRSTYNCLNYFYPLVVSGGWVIIDDYYLSSTDCGEAVNQFIKENKLKAELKRLGNYQAGWQKI
ncbi:MAG: TylF/MycF family methyltransferase [Bacteroidia bacterium]|nr:TylF/MycF family methyltransferase [Bacteroidia bacterium]